MKPELLIAAAALLAGSASIGLVRPTPDAESAGTAQRVVAMSPSVTETLFALGAGPRVVGVSAGVMWPPEALRVERVGGWYDVDLERLVGLRPDLVFVQGLHAAVCEQAGQLDIRVRRVEMGTLRQIDGAVRQIGAALGMPGEADALARRIGSEIEAVRERTRGRRPLRTFLCLAHETSLLRPPFLTAGGETFLGEVLEAAGGSNVFADAPRPYVEISAENLIERRPDVIMVSLPGQRLAPGEPEPLRAAWRAILPQATGRPAARVVFLTADCAQVPGPRVGELAREMERLLWTTDEGVTGRETKGTADERR
jgi:iron complex transport system substrate-binding protein